jgi:hypothetical protein
MEKDVEDPKEIQRTAAAPASDPIVSKSSRADPAPMSAPVPWSLAWCEDGELAPQDRFDLLQTLVMSENQEVQPTLIAVMEQLSLQQVTVLASDDVTGLCT